MKHGVEEELDEPRRVCFVNQAKQPGPGAHNESS